MISSTQESPQPETLRVRITREMLLANYVLFAIVVLGLTVKEFHKEWIGFRNARKKSLILAPRDHGKCLSGDTDILLANGSIKKIKELIGKTFKVVTLKNNYKFFSSKKVRVISNGVKKVYELITRSGRRITLTANHPLFTINGWQELKNLKSKDRIAVPRTYEHLKFKEKELPKGTAKFLGYMIGDGSCSSVTFTGAEQEYVTDFKEACSLLGFNVKKMESTDYGYTINANSSRSYNPRILLKKYGLFGKNSYSKFIPNEIFFAPKKQIAEFIAAYFNCDGYVNKLTSVSTLETSSQSKILTRQLQHLLLRFGITAKVRTGKSHFKGELYPSWVLSIYGKDNINKFLKYIPILGPKKIKLMKLVKELSSRTANPVCDTVPLRWIERLKNVTRGKLDFEGIGTYSTKYGTSRNKVLRAGTMDKNKDLANLGTSDLLWDEIVSITYKGEEETYDLSVPITHNFVANDIVVHNSMLLTIGWLIWRILKNPNIKIMLVGNSAGVAAGFLEAIKSHFERNLTLIKIFGNQKGSLWNKDAIVVKGRTLIGHKEPTISTAGVYGSIVSGHYDILVLEDLVDFENSRSKTQRDKLWAWFWTVLFPTIETNEEDKSKDGEMHFLGTRYHFDDLYGRMIGEVEEFKPGALIGNYKIYNGLMGDEIQGWWALWPERKSAQRLLDIRKDVGSIIFDLQYQNDAQRMKGRIFAPGDFLKTWTELPPKTIKLAGYDLATSQKNSADYFSEAVIYMDKQYNVYIERVWRTRMSAPKQFEWIKASHEQHKWSKCGVESVAYQEALSQWLRENSKVPVKSVHRHIDKIMRAYKIQPLFESGKVFMKKGVNFTEFIDEMLMMPDGEHDDLFDAFETAVSLGYQGTDFKFFFIG